MKGCTEILSLCQYRAPTQPRLKSLQAQLFKKLEFIVYREPPLHVVIVEKRWCRSAPATTRLPIWTRYGGTHELSSRQKLFQRGNNNATPAFVCGKTQHLSLA